MVDEGERVARKRPLQGLRRAPGNPAALRSFAIPSRSSPGAQLASLRRVFRVRSDGGGDDERLFLDTFDERFRCRDQQLAIRGGGTRGRAVLEWVDLRKRRTLREPVETVPAFAAELPSGAALRPALLRVADVRRLFPTARVSEAWRAYRVEDQQGKTVVRLRFEKATARTVGPAAEPVPLPAVVHVSEVRGYSGAFREVCRYLERERGLGRASAPLHERAYAGLGRPPAPSATFAPDLEPTAPASRAALGILADLRQVMIANEDGIRGDLDIEYLHDFRVAVRRSRTLLRTFGRVLACPDSEAVKAGLRWLGQVTGPTRDADVHRLALRQEIDRSRSDDRAALGHLASRLETRRELEWKRLVAALDSPQHARVMARIEAFTDPTRPRPGASAPRLDRFAAESLEAAFRRFLKRGRKLARGAPDAKVHRVRIEAKRLRYLLEAFRSLYPGAEIARDIKALRRVQDELGAFNDAAVQQRALRALAREAAEDRDSGADEPIAAGRVIERLENEKERYRRRVVKRFERFDSRAVRDGFERLWRPAGGSGAAAPR